MVLRVLICVRRCSLYMDIPGLSLLLHFQICTWTICAYAGLYQRQRDRDREIYGRDRGIVREKETEHRVRKDKPFRCLSAPSLCIEDGRSALLASEIPAVRGCASYCSSISIMCMDTLSSPHSCLHNDTSKWYVMNFCLLM